MKKKEQCCLIVCVWLCVWGLFHMHMYVYYTVYANAYIRCLTISDSKQDTSWRTHGSRQFWFRLTFWREVSVRILREREKKKNIILKSETYTVIKTQVIRLRRHVCERWRITAPRTCLTLKDFLQCALMPVIIHYLLNFCLHRRGNGGWRNELEGWWSIVGILGRKLHHQMNLMAAKVGWHHTAAVDCVHLDTKWDGPLHAGLTKNLVERLKGVDSRKQQV